MGFDAPTHQLAIFASGAGTNARQLMDYFSNHPFIRVRLLVCNKPAAGALQVAAEFGVETYLLQRATFREEGGFLRVLSDRSISFLVLAGFLWLIPPYLVEAYRGRILNVHPSLLPQFGGKGMYGMRVHEAVYAAGASQTGITIHEVNEQYDEGSIVLQQSVALAPEDTPETIRQKVQQLEHEHLAPTVEQFIKQQKVLLT